MTLPTGLNDLAKLTLIAVLLLMVVSPQLAGCAEIKPVYPIYDSGKPGVGISGWLDNDTVVFYSEQRAQVKPGTQGPPPVLEAGYYVWNTAKGSLIIDSSLEDVAKVCVQGDVVTFLRKSPTDEKKWLVVTRENGQETVTPLVKTEWFNRFSCRYYEQKPQWDRGYASLPLLEWHGSLLFKDSRQNNPILFFPPNNETGVPLPIGTRQVWHNLVQYAPFKNAYLLYPIAYVDPETGKEEPVGPWPKGKPVLVWWLSPDGKVTTENIPYMPFMRGGSRGFFPTREGIFLFTHKTDGMWKPGDAGGYLTKNGNVIKLITGMLENVTVSPDGCNVAFLHDPYIPEPVFERVKMKVINVCEEARHVR
jgi:hypothetical protein